MTPDAAPRDPWDRFGWLMWSAWLVFLVFPVAALLASDHPWWLKTLGILLVLGFAVVYSWQMIRLTRRVETHLPVPEPVLALAVLVAIAAAEVPLIGLSTISFVPFLQAFGVFALPRPLCWWWAALVAAASTLLVAQVLGPDDLSFLLILLGVTAAAVAGRLLEEFTDAYESARRGQSVAEERDRVARDVHDVLGHSLTVLSLKAELAQRLIDTDPARARVELDDIARLSREALAEVRATVGGLRAARLDEEVAGARVALGDRGIEAQLPEDLRVADPRYRPVMGWVLREAVTNVLRHSDAQRCVVRLEERALVVEDDGQGLDGSHEGNGLRGLRQRVEQAGGRFVVEPREGGGTRLGVHW